MNQLSAEVLCLGNEILIGRVVNSNASYISLKLTKLGFQVNQHLVIRDDLQVASAVMKQIRDRSPDVLIISGGLGPTHDDIQLSCIADALNIPLTENDMARDLLIDRFGNSQLDRFTKLFHLPKGSIALNNSVGSAPGVLTLVDGKRWISLPGVPGEMKAIMEEEVLPLLSNEMKSHKMIEYGFEAFNVGESKITQITNLLVEKYSNVYFKSHPKFAEKTYWLSLHAYSFGEENKEMVLKAINEWKDNISSTFNVETTDIKPVFDDDFEYEQNN
ncbi:MAG: molybdopterin-binding protein [Candidatus Heimdallarchaeota archaeon]|nr:molybdopterin-binding protein [Candidatus Heimdallarchaeota archaeon]